MNLAEFYNELERHDWFYQFSDDHGVWCAGERDCNRLKAIAETSPEHRKLMSDFAAYHYSGESFGKPQAPKPERPK
jgi:hypothetical protein